MSWFAELTSRAEDVLNKLDENAAVILSNPKSQKKDFILVDLSSDGVNSESNSVLQDGTLNIALSKNNSDIKRRTNVNDANIALQDDTTFNNVKSTARSSILKKNDDSVRVEVLQNEIQTLTHEMSLLMHRTRVSEQEACDLKSQLETIRRQNEILQDKISNLSNGNDVFTDAQISREVDNSRSFLVRNNDNNNADVHVECESESGVTVSTDSMKTKNLISITRKFEVSEISKQTENNNPDGRDIRIQALMKSVTDKQSALELMAAEKSALEFQLDLVRRKHYELLNLKNSVSFSVNDTDDAKAQLPNFLRESPFDTRVARHVKKAYSSIDSISIRAGVFLRRYPLFRISAFFYVILMHVWVLLVLFSYMPESKS